MRFRLPSPRFSLKLLLIAVAFCALLATWYSRELDWHRRRTQALAKLGEPLLEDDPDWPYNPTQYRVEPFPPNGAGPTWTERLLGEAYTPPTYALTLTSNSILGEDDWAHIRRKLPEPWFDLWIRR
ncbi:MAG: hypothetical protein QM811_04820 [Pirellulales bacterium]